MSAPARVSSRLQTTSALPDALLLGWFFLHVLFFVQPHLIYQTRGVIFPLAGWFAVPFFGYSGGPAAYVSQFLGQLNAFGWPGALALTLQAGLIGWLSRACFRHIAGRPVRFLHLVPMVLFMLECGRYAAPAAAGPALIVTLAGVLAFAEMPLRAPRARFGTYLAIAAAVYYAAGGAMGKLALVLMVALFAVLCALIEARRAGDWMPAAGWGTACLLAPAAIALLGERYLLSARAADWDTWLAFTPTWKHALVLGPLLFLPPAAIALAARLPERLAGLAGRARAAKGRQPKEPAAPSPAGPLRRLLGTAALLWGVNTLALNVTVDDAGRQRAERDHLAVNGLWDQILADAALRREEGYDVLTCHDVDMALLRAGKLADEMFAYPQHPEALVLPLENPESLGSCLRLADQWLLLGRPTDAEHVLHDSLAVAGNNPFLLRRLAVVYMVKGEIAAARVPLNLLRQDVVHGAWARETLAQLDRDPLLAGDGEIQRARLLMLADDDILRVTRYRKGSDALNYDEAQMLVDLLERNPRNRMALDCLMGMYLLQGKVEMVARELHRLDAFGEKRIPRSWEEGLVILFDRPGPKPDLRGRDVSEETRRRYARFREILAQNGNSGRRAYPQVAAELPDTYFAYLLRMEAPR